MPQNTSPQSRKRKGTMVSRLMHTESHAAVMSSYESASLLNDAVDHYVSALCESGHYARLSPQPHAQGIPHSPVYFLSSTPSACDTRRDHDVPCRGEHMASETCRSWLRCGVALSRFTVAAETDQDTPDELTISCELSPLLVRSQTLAELTIKLGALPHIPDALDCVVPFTCEGERCGVTRATCCAAMTSLARAGGVEAVALLHGLPRVRLDAFATSVPPLWSASGAQLPPMCGRTNAAIDDRRMRTERQMALLRPYVPPAFVPLLTSAPEGWYLVRYPDGCPELQIRTSEATPASESSMSSLGSPLFVLPASLVVRSLTCQVGSLSIPPAHRRHAAVTLSHAVCHANECVPPLTARTTEAQPEQTTTLTFTTRAAGAISTSHALNLSLHAASSLTLGMPAAAERL